MKTKFVLIIAACASLALVSCKDKNTDTLAKLNPVAIEDANMLPFINSFEEEDFCNSAKALLPSDAQKDSLSYLAGIQFAADASYSFKGIDMDRFNKAVEDFQSVDFKAFNEAAQTNFMEENAVSDKFEINPGLLGQILNKVAQAPEGEEVSHALRDSASYIYGVLCGFRMAGMDMNPDRVRKSMENFFAVDTDSLFMKHASQGFRDSTYAEYAKKFEIAPDLFQGVYQRINKAKEDAKVENVKIQSKLFIEEAAKRNSLERKSVEYKTMEDTVEVTKTADILYRFNKKAEVEGPVVELGDSMTVTYNGRHIDYSVFDEGSFPVNGLTDDQLVKGFTAALLLLREGDEIEVVIPGELAYGERGNYNPWMGGYVIYPNETLVFTFSVSDLRKPVAAEEVVEEVPVEE